METGQYIEGIVGVLSELEKQDFPRRLWDKDTTLWSSKKYEQKQIGNAL